MGENAHPFLPWSDAPFLLALARAGTFMGAARDLRVDRTTVARRLDRLEGSLGTKLFERRLGTLELTPHGRRILAIVERAEQELGQVQPDNDDLRVRLGKVRLALSPHVLAGFGAEITQFATDHPKLFLDLATSDHFVDLHRYEADISLRVSATPPAQLHSLEIGPVPFGLYRRADQTGPIKTAFALPGQTRLAKKFLPDGEQPEILAAVDGVLPTRDLILSGAGAGVLPAFLGRGDRRLSLCTDTFSDGAHRLWMSCLPEQKNLSRIKTVLRMLFPLLSAKLQHRNSSH